MNKLTSLVAAAAIAVGLSESTPAKPSAPWAKPTATVVKGVAAREAALGKDAALMWDVAPNEDAINAEHDALLKSTVLVVEKSATTLTSRFAVTPGMELSYQVRLATTPEVKSTYAIFSFLADPPPAPPPPNTPNDNDFKITLHGTFDGAAGGFNFKPYPTVSPALKPEIRLPIEQDMANAPKGQDHWFVVRVQIGEGWIRGWVDDRLIVDKRNANLKGLRPVIQLYPNARLANLRVDALVKPNDRFETIPMDGYVTTRQLGKKSSSALRDDALPYGQTVEIDGVPVRFADLRASGNLDHIDITPSLCRQGDWEGYHAANSPRFGGTVWRDPARIQLAVPNASYRNLYVVAAFDEQDDKLPVLSAVFYRPGASFPMVFESTVPGLTAKEATATPLPVKLQNGDSAQLWLVKIPLDPAMVASFSDLKIVELELTKRVYQHRSYPDPYMYGWHQGGLPSGVRVFAVTLERPTVDMVVTPSQFGHVWQAGQTPRYTLALRNQTAQPRAISATIQTVSFDKQESPAPQTKPVSVAPGQTLQLPFDLPVKKNGIHSVTITLTDSDQKWTEQRNLCLLAKDTRAEKWTPGQGALYGYWSYSGGHYTPSADENVRLMAWAGARSIVHKPSNLSPEVKRDYWDRHAMRDAPNAWPVKPQWALAGPNPDPAKVAAFKEQIVKDIITAQGENPAMVTFFPEPHISLRMTFGTPPDYWGEKPLEMNEQEKAAFGMFWNTSKFAAEAVRAKWPNTKILIPWGDPLFVVPFLRAGFPKEYIDGSGLDMIGFERLPEQQIHQQSTHRLYILKNEYKKFGIDKPVLPYVEGIFVPTEPGAVTWTEQADMLHRWNLISLAYGIEQFYSSWTTFDAGSYYGTEHYAGCGIFRRIPFADPKPAYANFATMTRVLDRANFKRWLPTGSLTTYCLEFEHPERGPIYALWTVRGSRPVTLTLEKDGQATLNDAMDNATVVPSKNGSVTATITTSPLYIYGAGAVKSVSVGEPDHSEAMAFARTRNQKTWSTGVLARGAVPEIQHEIKLASLGDGKWKNTSEQDEVYATNNYDTYRYHGRMTAAPVADEGHGKALAVKLGKQDAERKLMPFYTVIKPNKPVEIPGKAAALGMWVKAHSEWGRVIYSLRDAKGERWISIGFKDEWNCDDVHSWSAFNFDGWRYLRFELPSHLPYDNYREHGTTWWRFAGGDDVVDLPLSVEKIIVERRTHVLYVNDIQPTDAENHDVLLGDLIAEYGSAENAGDEVVKLSRVRMTLPKSEAEMANPIKDAANNPLAATKLHGVKDPDWGYDGTRCHVNFEPVEGIKQYQVWVSAHPDGRGAQPMGNMTASGQVLEGLRAQTTFYLWVTYTDAEKKASKPSNRLEIKLVDAFGMK